MHLAVAGSAALELAAWAAEKRIEYADALKRLRDAEKLADRTQDTAEWARVQFAIAWVLHDQGRYGDAEHILREVLTEQERTLGPEHPDTLATRNNLANALSHQGKYAEAETEYHAVLALKEKVLGPEHPDTLRACFDLARCLQGQGDIQEARVFAERAVDGATKVRPEHPDTKKYEQLRQQLLAKSD